MMFSCLVYSVMMSEGGGSSSSSSGQGRPITHHLWLRQRQQDEDDDDDDEEEGGGEETSKGGDVVVVGGGGATTLYSREDGATVLEAADGTTTVLRPHAHAGAHRLTVTVEGEEGGVGVVGGEGVTAIVDGQTGTATLVEGAEVVRTQAVSYATPILHQVFLQAAPPATSLAHTAHTTLLHTTTHAPALQPSVGRRPPPPLLACTTAPTPIILHPPRAALRVSTPPWDPVVTSPHHLCTGGILFRLTLHFFLIAFVSLSSLYPILLSTVHSFSFLCFLNSCDLPHDVVVDDRP